jgi:protein-S-isoprenylcysteine O-methyltransferase Ste14
VAGIASIGTILFGGAGRLDWPAAWVFIAMFSVYLIAGMGYFSWKDPELLLERMNTPSNVPRWDRILVRVYQVLLGCLMLIAALDAGRYRWAPVPLPLQWLGAAGVLAAFVVVWWCTATNHYLASYARLQPDRGQRVVSEGPYAFVRHPMYTSMTVLDVSIALLLGSWLALVPAAAIGLLAVVRTRLEDRMLLDGLPGYRDYALHVPRRLVPGVW